MLVLSRKTSETICIGDDIVITVIEVRGNKCRIGITAPDNVRIIRPEICSSASQLVECLEPSAVNRLPKAVIAR